MASSKDKGARSKQADSELRAKRRLEKPVADDFSDLFGAMADDLRAVYASSGAIVDAANYDSDITGILRRAYRAASAEFGDVLQDDMVDAVADANNVLGEALRLHAERSGEDVGELIAQYSADKHAAMSEFIGDAVVSRTAMISATNKTALAKSVERALVDAIRIHGSEFQASTVLGRRQVADIAHGVFLESNLYRAKMIAATEVQNAAEGAKRIAATTLDETLKPVTNTSAVNVRQMKEWHTRGDDRVRDAHVAADLQVQPAKSPFVVGGQRMMEPADSSLGASEDNTINCRCSAVYFYDGEMPRL